MKPLGHLLATIVVGFFAFFALQKLFAATIEISLLFLALMVFAGWAVDVVQGMEIWRIALVFAVLLGLSLSSDVASAGSSESLAVSIVVALAFAGVVFWLRKRRSFTHYGYSSSLYALAYGTLAAALTRDYLVGILAVVLVRMHALIDHVLYNVKTRKSESELAKVQSMAALALVASALVFFTAGTMPEFEAIVFFAGSFLLFLNIISLAFDIQSAKEH